MDLGAERQQGGSVMALRELVERYRTLAGGFGQPVALRAFGLGRQDTERLFGAFDEDYHISRFFHFTMGPASPEETFSINSFPQSHVSLDPDIQTIL